jgi:uncharacterized C2H2 Zn-finger protein
MGKMVEVHNLNTHPYREHFRDGIISIPAKGFIEMEWEEAVMFKGTMNQVERDGDGNVLPTSYKMLKIVQDAKGKQEMEAMRAKETTFKCQACGFIAGDKQELHIHVKEEHAHQLTDPKVAKQLLKK